MASSNDTEDPAAAFDALRAEVRVLRQELAKVLGELKATQAPDVTPTLVAMQASLDAISAHPAMQLTPTIITRDIEAAAKEVERARRESKQAFELSASTLAGERKAHAAQVDNLMVTAGLAGLAIIAVMFCTNIAEEFILRALPADWGWREHWASHFVGHSPWDSGLRLMEFEDPKALHKMLENDIAVGDQSDLIQRCQDLARKLNKPQRCVITLNVPKGNSATN